MKSRQSDYLWVPLWVDKWIFGSTRLECSLEERSIWIDFLALAAKDDGYIRANENTPYPLDQLAGLLIIPKDLLQHAIEKFISTGKLENNNGIFKIVNWHTYKLSKRHKRRFEKDMSENADTMSEKEDTKTKQIKTKQIKAKQIYGQFQHVKLTKEEYQKLKEQLNDNLDFWIKELDEGIERMGYKYKSHYLTILKWAEKRKKEERFLD